MQLFVYCFRYVFFSNLRTYAYVQVNDKKKSLPFYRKMVIMSLFRWKKNFKVKLFNLFSFASHNGFLNEWKSFFNIYTSKHEK
jgi:hypothetical protein